MNLRNLDLIQSILVISVTFLTNNNPSNFLTFVPPISQNMKAAIYIYCLLLFINCIYFVKGLGIISYLYTYILLDIIKYMNIDKILINVNLMLLINFL